MYQVLIRNYRFSIGKGAMKCWIYVYTGSPRY